MLLISRLVLLVHREYSAYHTKNCVSESYLKGYALCRRLLLASRGYHLGARCLHFDIFGDHFSTSGTPGGGILAPRDRPGGPLGVAGWTQGGPKQDLHRFRRDLGTRVY